jgi:molecular chaperone DnaK
MQAAHKLAEKMYAGAQQGPGGDAGPQAAGGASKDDGDVVDAEFEEVKDRR